MGDAGRVVAFELVEAGAVGGAFGGAVLAGFFDGGVGEDAGGDEEGCHFVCFSWGGGGLRGGLIVGAGDVGMGNGGGGLRG